MLAKTADSGGCNRDRHLQYVLFTYSASQQQSTEELPFFLLHGRDPQLHVEAILSPQKVKALVNLKEYGSELANGISEP